MRAFRSLITAVASVLLVAGLSVGVPYAAVGASCGGRAPTIVGTPKDDVLVGTDGNDVIAGLGGDDRIRGRAGNDILCGGEGSDRLSAGSGDDALYGGLSGFHSDRGGSYYAGDLLRPGPGDDRVDGGLDTRVDEEDALQDTLDYSRATRGVELDLSTGTATGEGTDAIVSTHGWGVVGSPFDDSLTGTGLNDVLRGERGDDIVQGGGGDDGLGGDTGSGADTGRDVLSGGDGDDSLYTARGADALSGGPGDDSLFDYDNDDDVLHGDDGDDNVVAGKGGGDQLFGDAGNDTLDDYLVPGTGQVLDGGPGMNTAALRTQFVRDQTPQRPAGTTDLRDGTTSVEWPEPTFATVRNIHQLNVPARWTVWGTDGAETIRGAYDGPLTVHAGGGNDRLIGTVYADVLDGGDGIDAARPGKGNDTCVSIERTNLAAETCNETAVVGPAEIVSVGSGGAPHLARSRGTFAPSVSADGRYVAFNSSAALVPEDTNSVSDIYVRDRWSERTERVSVTSRGAQLTMGSHGTDISADGRYVVFGSRGAAVESVHAGVERIYVHDRRTGQTSMASVNNDDRPAGYSSFSPTISADGSRIAFLSYAQNLGGPGGPHIYVRDQTEQRTTLVTVLPDGTPSLYDSYAPTISDNGRFVLFASSDQRLSGSDRSGLFVRDLRRERTDWVDRPPAYYQPSSISANGRFVAFTRLDPQCAGQIPDCTVVMVRDRRSGTLHTASLTPDGRLPNGGSALPVLSGDGQQVVFTSWASNLVNEEGNLAPDVFVHDLTTGLTTLVSTDSEGGPADGPSGSPGEELPGLALSANGRWVVFESSATDLVGIDANARSDLFARSWRLPR